MTVRILLSYAATTLWLGACAEPAPELASAVQQTSGHGERRGRDDHRGHRHRRGRCEKVNLCHVPPGNPARMHRISVGRSTAEKHVRRHGDGVCAEGATDCCAKAGGGSVCTNVGSDRENCGACGVVCSSEQSCSAGHCVGGDDTTPPDPGTGGDGREADAGTSGGGPGGGGPGGGGPGGGGPSTCAPGTTRCGEACVDFENDRNHCGECNFQCVAESPGCQFAACVRPPCQFDAECLQGEICQEGACVSF